jgi:hypothetical protein
MSNVNDIILCECASKEHQLWFATFDSEPNEVFLSIHLSNLKFLERIKYGIKYIFGYKSKYGAFDEMIIDKSKLKELLNKL